MPDVNTAVALILVFLFWVWVSTSGSSAPVEGWRAIMSWERLLLGVLIAGVLASHALPAWWLIRLILEAW